MAITRKALLISNPGEIGDENYCRGVYVDIRNFTRLLKSAYGGAWTDAEIQTFDRPTKKDLAVHLFKCELADYAFILFTGHGAFSQELGEPILELQADISVPLSYLLAPKTKRTVVLDCCQKILRGELIENRALASFSAKQAHRREPDFEACRRIFDARIEVAAASAVIPQSCAVDEYSTADNSRGSRYAASLIEAADRWASQQAEASYHEEAYSIITAHEQAASTTRRISGGDQNPTISSAKTGPYFPFAVFG